MVRLPGGYYCEHIFTMAGRKSLWSRNFWFMDGQISCLSTTYLSNTIYVSHCLRSVTKLMLLRERRNLIEAKKCIAFCISAGPDISLTVAISIILVRNTPVGANETIVNLLYNVVLQHINTQSLIYPLRFLTIDCDQPVHNMSKSIDASIILVKGADWKRSTLK